MVYDCLYYTAAYNTNENIKYDHYVIIRIIMIYSAIIINYTFIIIIISVFDWIFIRLNFLYLFYVLNVII